MNDKVSGKRSAGTPETRAGDTDVIRTSKLRKEFDDLVAVDDVDLRVGHGLLYGMIGPNGSGKTTMIKMLVGLLRPTSGAAHVMGEPIPIKAHVGNIGYMPQDLAIYPDLTVHENMELFAELYSVEDERFKMRENDLLSIIDLSGRKDSLVSQLSGGMKHRTSLACALVHDPELVFLDEPTVGVDPELRAGFWKYFSDLKSKGKTVVLTTHYMDEAVRCDIVGMMRGGRLIAEGTPDDLMKATGTKDLESAFLAFSRKVAK